MTDAELIARLRKGETPMANHYMDEAADRIEALTEQLTAAQHDAKEAEAYAEELEAKLAENEVRLRKAVEALELIVVDSTWGLEHQTYMKCRKALAAIKGETK